MNDYRFWLHGSPLLFRNIVIDAASWFEGEEEGPGADGRWDAFTEDDDEETEKKELT